MQGSNINEEEARTILIAIIHKEQRRMQTLLKPFMEELGRVELRRPMQPVELPDGRIIAYKGPSATEIAGPYVAPKWLWEMVIDDPELRHVLDQCRRRSSATQQSEEGDHSASRAMPGPGGWKRGVAQGSYSVFGLTPMEIAELLREARTRLGEGDPLETQIDAALNALRSGGHDHSQPLAQASS